MRVLAIVMLLSATASARPQGEEFDKDLHALDHSLVHPAPGPHLDRATAGAPRWCKGVKNRDEAWPSQIAGGLDNYRKGTSQQSSLVEVAAQVCSVNDPVYHHAATEVLQYWINETGLSEADAIASLAARVDTDAWSAEHDALCSKIDISGYASTEPGAIAEARHTLFGCNGDPAWMSVQGQPLDNLRPFLDRGAVDRDHDEIVRTAWIDGEVAHMLDPNADAKVLANYATTAYDIAQLDYDAATKQLDAAPYRGNRYAKTVLRETIGRTKLNLARLDAAVAKRTEDARWKELIVTAPQAASAAWLAAAKKREAELARSDKVAATILAKGDLTGCEAALKPDVLAVLKALPHGSVDELVSAASDDAVAGVLLDRLGECLHSQATHEVWRAVDELASAVLRVNGPRQAAYVATAKAAAGMKKGAPFSAYYDMHPMQQSGGGERGGELDSSMLNGVIASIDKTKSGVTLKFVSERYQYDAQECAETSKVDRIDADGKVIYRRECHAAGKAWADKAPGPTEVPAACTAGLAKGRFIHISFGIPLAVFADKTAKKLLAAHCLSLE